MCKMERKEGGRGQKLRGETLSEGFTTVIRINPCPGSRLRQSESRKTSTATPQKTAVHPQLFWKYPAVNPQSDPIPVCDLPNRAQNLIISSV